MAALTRSSSFGGGALIGSSDMRLEVRKVYRQYCLGKIERRAPIATDALGNVGSGQAVVR